IASAGPAAPGSVDAPPPPPPPPAKAPDKAELARRWPVRGAVFMGLLGVFLLFGGFGAWAMFTRIAGAVVAPGQVEVEQHRQIVQHPDGGVIEEIQVSEGDTVEAGQT
ncbi:HlyD family type I secretion periplasmic adaptor subunit, partial [Glutamicibacter soli]|nr:HlyD family type I secretion periplasmic adaptor subunit [Glutamicibacter soli]